MHRARRLHSIDKVLVKLGSAYSHAYDFPEAERWFEEGVRVSPTKVGALNAVGHHWLEVRNFEAARNCFERVLPQNPVPIVTFVRLSEIYLRLRRPAEALEMAERALKLYGPHEGALLMRAKIYRQMREWNDAEKFLRLVVAKSDSDVGARAAAWYELGAVLDQRGAYDEAMAAILQAKSLMNLSAARPLKILRMKQAQMKEMQKIPEGTVQRWRKFGQTELQPERKLALLCGHARSGTTLLEYVVDSHPDVISSEETSILHNVAYYPIGRATSSNSSLVSALDWMSARTLRQIRADYFRGTESFLAQPIGERLLLDKNPANTFDLPPMARIFPESKFLVALRDPRDVCLSCFMQPVDL
ncbi:MAG: sulfotransferase, partial [Verrucomicrobiota bacterium]|nr:sulfotransferase [Verrucomicrobiota bacterium]